MNLDPPLPDVCPAAFKEWAGVCEALAEGRQTLILRKGGIAEGPGGFVPEHPVFWLYPTHVHEAEQGLRTEGRSAAPMRRSPDLVEIGTLVRVEMVAFADRLETLESVEGMHAWTRETVEKRFHYRKPGLWVLGVRVFRREPAIAIAVTPEHAGCRTWVILDPPVETEGVVPVLDDQEAALRLDQIRSTPGLDR